VAHGSPIVENSFRLYYLGIQPAVFWHFFTNGWEF